ncbi:MAG: hypothetical protein ABIC57_02455 [bacterium]
MNERVKKIIPALLFSLIFFLVLLRGKSYAYTGSCSTSLTPQERLECLNDEYVALSEEKASLENAIASEQQSQQSLSQQIQYLSYLIQKTEITISELELDIERNNIEIIILGEEIDELQVSIDTLTQEINILEDAMRERTKTGYKMSLISPLELILGSNNFETMLRKMKYIASIKEKDRQVLSEMSQSKTQLENEEDKLISDRAEVQAIRNETEEQRTELAQQKENLISQTAQQQNLLAESIKNEQSYSSELEATFSSINALTSEIAKAIVATGGSGTYVGYVPQGAVIGYMGDTGLAYGAHLHFCINNGTKYPGYSYFWGNIYPFPSYLTLGPDWYKEIPTFKYYYVRSKSMRVPLAGNVYWTQDYHQGLCIDMSTTLGKGAPVYSAWAGDLTRGVDIYGGKWALIEHSNGWVTTYLHLQ